MITYKSLYLAFKFKQMSLKKIIGSILPIADSNKRKQMVTDAILAADQKENGVLNVHKFNTTNVGDFYSGPHHYFEELKGKVLDIGGIREINRKKRTDWIENVSHNSLIIGGGGLLNLRHFSKQIDLFEALAKKGKKAVLWGCGHNETDRSKFGKQVIYHLDHKNFGLAGTRDYSMPTEFVPCVSCLHPIFDKKFSETQEIGILFNHKSIKNDALLNKLKDYPFTSNTTDLEEMVSFIGASNTIVTDSYHAMYWAMLLGKKTVVIPTTTKFFDFKYKPIFSSYEQFENELNKAGAYSGVLEECRDINLKFSEKVFNYLNI